MCQSDLDTLLTLICKARSRAAAGPGIKRRSMATRIRLSTRVWPLRPRPSALTALDKL